MSQVDSELCAQLTGMLLELDITTIQNLLKEPDLLKQAVFKAKQEYIKYTQVCIYRMRYVLVYIV